MMKLELDICTYAIIRAALRASIRSDIRMALDHPHSRPVWLSYARHTGRALQQLERALKQS